MAESQQFTQDTELGACEDKWNAGFSLVELAIVLVVIGLLIGGILKGQELIESARLKSVLSQLNEYRLATGIFVDRYGGLPGDYHLAREYIHDSLTNGDGDGRITGAGLGRGSQAQQYWAHLAAAQLISQPGKANDGQVGFGHGIPTSKIGGGFTVVYHPSESMPGQWFLLGGPHGDEGNGALLTPAQALRLDQQTDNGDPTSGRVRSLMGQGATHSCVKDGRYDLSHSNRACIIYFQF